MSFKFSKLYHAVAIALSLGLQGCGGSGDGASPSVRVNPSSLVMRTDDVNAEAATRFDAATTSADGTPIAFTVYAPSIAKGNSAPLVITGPGWGNERIKNLDTAAEDTLELVQQGAKLALAEGPQGGAQPTQGWYVIAFDQRGFGQSGGVANIQDPAIEGKDIQAIIDWAEKNLTRLSYRKTADGRLDPVVGTLGGSYGGGFQTIGAGVDKRIDAMVPAVTWYNLSTTLFDKPKSLWGALLFTDKASPFVQQALGEALSVGKVNDAALTELYQHSPASYCEGKSTRMTRPNIPSFVIQGAGDTLFNLTEGINNFECLRKANPNSKFLGIRAWHTYDALIPTAPKTVQENRISCGNNSLSVARLQFSFLAQNLVDSRLDATNSNRYLTLPDIRVVLDDGKALRTTGESVESGCYEVASATAQANGQIFKRGGSNFAAQVGGVTAGLPASLSSLIDKAPLELLTSPATVSLFAPDAGKLATLVSASSSKRTIVGIPKVSMKVAAASPTDAGANAPIVFVGLVRVRADGSREVLHDQVTPVEGFGDKSFDLPGMSTSLLPGESIAAIVYGFHPRYYKVYSRTPVNVNVTDLTISMPFIE
ncbi:CocE/NonD family hydrolase [Herbaspirillum sp. GCM10030257]|uniref:CocE/NonD family hydrolase n=1 Tax=Herbaspirillum sp. GCM10030257 TaxID=3273393 RepID=UPI003612FCDB